MIHTCINPYIHASKKVRHSATFKTQNSTASCHRAGRHYRVHPERGGGALPGQDAGIPLRRIHGARVSGKSGCGVTSARSGLSASEFSAFGPADGKIAWAALAERQAVWEPEFLPSREHAVIREGEGDRPKT